MGRKKETPPAKAPAFLPVLIVPSLLFAFMAFDFRDLGPRVEGLENRETISPADIDGDGDLDFYSSVSVSVWFENTGGGNWVRRPVSDSFDTDVGACAFDVDGDGRIDRVSGSFWHRNLPGPSGPAFTTYRFREERGHVHDQIAADIDGDGRIDIIDIAYDGIRWFRNPEHPSAGYWVPTRVNPGTDPDGLAQHGGIAAGDIDGDGDVDIARLNVWFENADGKGETWIRRGGIPFGKQWESGWGLSGRALLHDLDGDGALDLIQADCDHPNGSLAVFFNRGGKGQDWERVLVKDSTDGQDFHSLALADFDGDGDADLFSMGGPNSASEPQAYVWENLDGKGRSWREHAVYRGLDGHDAAVLDLDGDGDLDVISKSWKRGLHYWLENTRIGPQSLQKPAGHARRRGRESSFPGFRLRPAGELRDILGRRKP